MKITFTYNTKKDIFCLLNYGNKSSNSIYPTNVYKLLMIYCSGEPSLSLAKQFSKDYIKENNINFKQYISLYQDEWDAINRQFELKAKKIFKSTLPIKINAYLTINNRCPYNIKENFFFIKMPLANCRLIVMHELWHFYTWKKFGLNWEIKLGKKKYNIIKESLTALINIECEELLPNGLKDVGYTQHEHIRAEIIKIWNLYKDIDVVWDEIVNSEVLFRS